MGLKLRNRFDEHARVLRGPAGRSALTQRGYGAGWRDVLKSLPERVVHAIRGKREGAPPDVRAFLAAHGNEPVLAYSVCRVPIASGVRTALDVLTLGAFGRAARALNYDNIFHLFTTLQLPSGGVQFEKNEVIRVLTGAPKKGECLPVRVPHGLTLSLLFDRAQRQNSAFYQYSTTNNCQRFTMDLLRGSGLDTPSLTQFVVQDAGSLISGFAKTIADTVTDVAARGDIIRSGVGGKYWRTLGLFR